jgi:hypothetical protein
MLHVCCKHDTLSLQAISSSFFQAFFQQVKPSQAKPSLAFYTVATNLASTSAAYRCNGFSNHTCAALFDP